MSAGNRLWILLKKGRRITASWHNRNFFLQSLSANPNLSFMNDVTQILNALARGDRKHADELLALVYNELRTLASQKLAHEKPDQTLQATALVHEAYLRLVASAGRESIEDAHWDNRRHFFAAAAEAMRRILIERARRKKSVKHGGGLERIELDEAIAIAEPRDDVLAIDEALSRLAEKQPVKAELVKLRFFGGLTMPEAADILGISLATAERYWTFARSWLYAELADVKNASN
jgi:RNA polymerase sigma factor (TIGR02999 family)